LYLPGFKVQVHATRASASSDVKKSEVEHKEVTHLKKPNSGI
jgi:hypothetical protein